MKKLTLLLIFTFSISLLSAQNKDEEAIKKVIITEFDAFTQGDYDTWASTYVDAPSTTFMVTPATTSGALFAVSDFQKISTMMKAGLKPPKPGTKPTMTLDSRDNWIFRIKGDMAFAIYDEVFLLNTGVKVKSKTQKVMEKVNEKWKIATTSAICDFNNAVVPNPNPEEEAIKKVIINETEMWLDQNRPAWSENFIHEHYLTWTVTNGGEPGDALTMRGWEALNSYMDKWFNNDRSALTKEWRKAKTTRDQWQIQIRGNVAYVSFNAHSDGEKQKMDMTETRVLERINGVWKIAMQATVGDFKDATPPIRSKY